MNEAIITPQEIQILLNLLDEVSVMYPLYKHFKIFNAKLEESGYAIKILQGQGDFEEQQSHFTTREMPSYADFMQCLLAAGIASYGNLDKFREGLKDFLDVIVSADMSGKRKPEPDSILLALQKLGVEAEEAAIVGDSLRRDIEAGKRLGMLTIYAAYGDRNFFESKKGEADFVAEKPEDILKIFDFDSQ